MNNKQCKRMRSEAKKLASTPNNMVKTYKQKNYIVFVNGSPTVKSFECPMPFMYVDGSEKAIYTKLKQDWRKLNEPTKSKIIR
jgi:hypothetical protein